MFFCSVHFFRLQYRFNHVLCIQQALSTATHTLVSECLIQFSQHTTQRRILRFSMIYFSHKNESYHLLFTIKTTKSIGLIFISKIKTIHFRFLLFVLPYFFFVRSVDMCIGTYTTLRWSYRTKTQSEFLILVCADAVLLFHISTRFSTFLYSIQPDVRVYWCKYTVFELVRIELVSWCMDALDKTILLNIKKIFLCRTNGVSVYFINFWKSAATKIELFLCLNDKIDF